LQPTQRKNDEILARTKMKNFPINTEKTIITIWSLWSDFCQNKGYGEAEGPTMHQWINPVRETTIEILWLPYVPHGMKLNKSSKSTVRFYISLFLLDWLPTMANESCLPI
jgi:hypothetical protein